MGAFENDTVSEITGYSAKGTVKGFGIGLYGTWFEIPFEQKGKYVDLWVIWNRFDNDIKGEP